MPYHSMSKRGKRFFIGVFVGAFAVVGILIAYMVLGSGGIPADVYSRPIPDADVLPQDILPSSICGYFCLVTENHTGVGCVVASAQYSGLFIIEISRFISTASASYYLDSGHDHYSKLSGTVAYLRMGEKHWFTYTGSAESVFAWQKGIWVFAIFAPDKQTRNEVALEFPY